MLLGNTVDLQEIHDVLPGFVRKRLIAEAEHKND